MYVCVYVHIVYVVGNIYIVKKSVGIYEMTANFLNAFNKG